MPSRQGTLSGNLASLLLQGGRTPIVHTIDKMSNILNIAGWLEAILIFTQVAAVLMAAILIRRRSGWKVRIHDAASGETLGLYNLGWTESSQCYKFTLSGLQLLKACASTHGFVNGTPSEWTGACFKKKEISVRVTPRG